MSSNGGLKAFLIRDSRPATRRRPLGSVKSRVRGCFKSSMGGYCLCLAVKPEWRSGLQTVFTHQESCMPAITRRKFVGKSATDVALAGLLSAAARELHADPIGIPVGAARALHADPIGIPVGSQTYPHRQRIKDGDFAGLCKGMAALGVGSLELCSPGYGELTSLSEGKHTRKVLEDHGLKCPSAHFEMN